MRKYNSLNRTQLFRTVVKLYYVRSELKASLKRVDRSLPPLTLLHPLDRKIVVRYRKSILRSDRRFNRFWKDITYRLAWMDSLSIMWRGKEKDYGALISVGVIYSFCDRWYEGHDTLRPTYPEKMIFLLFPGYREVFVSQWKGGLHKWMTSVWHLSSDTGFKFRTQFHPHHFKYSLFPARSLSALTRKGYRTHRWSL